MKLRSASAALFLAWGASFSGCAAAVVGAGGAVAGIAYNDRGVESDVKGSVKTVEHHTAESFKQMGIKMTENEVKDAGTQRTYEGRKGDTDVTVKMKHTTADMTHVEVYAKSGTLKWDKDYAKEVMQAIVKKSS